VLFYDFAQTKALWLTLLLITGMQPIGLFTPKSGLKKQENSS